VKKNIEEIMSLLNKENKSGPRTETCGTPWITREKLKNISLQDTLSSIVQVRPDTPNSRIREIKREQLSAK
jgi:hypothetical protein